jgi:hypoxanthine phosphoribosyltransferase
MPDPTPLLDADALATRIAAMGAEIRAAYGPETPITCVSVLKGSVIFLSDLVRHIPGPVELEFLGVASYEGTRSTGEVRITHDLRASVQDKHVLIVEDIVDTGLTLAFLREAFSVRKPASLRVAALLDKPTRRKVEVEVDFTGFTIPDAFVVGFGLDLDERYRNLPYVGIYQG